MIVNQISRIDKRGKVWDWKKIRERQRIKVEMQCRKWRCKEINELAFIPLT